MKKIALTLVLFAVVSIATGQSKVKFTGTQDQKIETLKNLSQDEQRLLKEEFNRYITETRGLNYYPTAEEKQMLRIEFLRKRKGIALEKVERKK